MQYKALIISATLFILLGGLILVWWMSKPSTITPSAQISQTSTSYPSNQTSVETTAQNKTQAQTALDLNTAYNALFQKILAQKIVFAQTRTASEDASGIYTLYSQDIADAKKSFPAAVNLSVGIAVTDLNEDGVLEVLVFENLPGACGTAGCPFDIYKKEKGKWVNIFSSLTGEDIGISNTYTNKYADLFLAKENAVVRYTWDGKTYNPGEVMAVWDGSTFHTTQ